MNTETTEETERLHEAAIVLLRHSGFGVVDDSGEAVIVINPNSETLYGPRSTATRYASPQLAVKQLLKDQSVIKE